MKKHSTPKSKKSVVRSSGAALWEIQNLPLLAGFVIISACFVLTLNKLSSVRPKAITVNSQEITNQSLPVEEPVPTCIPSPEVFSGIGARLEQVESKIYIQKIISGSPAEKNEIMPGDVIYRIEDTPVVDINDAVSRIRGEPGTSVRLILYRGNLRLDKTVIRESITDDKALICQ